MSEQRITGPGNLPIGIIPGSVPDSPTTGPPLRQLPPHVAPPLSARGLAEQIAARLESVERSLRRLVALSESPVRNFLAAGTVAGGSTVGTTPAPVLNANPRRRGLSVQNTGTAGNLTIGLGTTAPISGQGLVLAPGASWDGRLSGMVWGGSVSVVGSASGVQYSFLEAMGGTER